jgi:hypothetical protein
MWIRSLCLFGQRVQPKEKLAHAAMQRERLLKKEGISRYNKRFRSWTQHRVRQYTLKRPNVSLTANASEMDGEYLAAAFQKAASLRKMDLVIWRKLANRSMQISDSISPEHIGYIFYGVGKSRFLHTKLVGKLLDRVVTGHLLRAMTSHGVMCMLWALRRTHIHPGDAFLHEVSAHLIKEEGKFRPKDFLKCLHSLAFFGCRKTDGGWRERISMIAKSKMDAMFAQDIRSATEPLMVANIYTDQVRKYVFDRFRGVAITARPHHLMKTMEAAVTTRILKPECWWEDISDQNRKFLTKLSERHINYPGKRRTPLHSEISATLEKMGMSHRMLLRMGPFTVDFTLEISGDEITSKKAVLLVDNLSSFLVNDFHLTEETILRHRLLHDMGLEIFRVSWHQWISVSDKTKFLSEVLAKGPVSPRVLLAEQEKLEAAEADRYSRLNSIEAVAMERRNEFRSYFEKYRRWLMTRPKTTMMT